MTKMSFMVDENWESYSSPILFHNNKNIKGFPIVEMFDLDLLLILDFTREKANKKNHGDEEQHQKYITTEVDTVLSMIKKMKRNNLILSSLSIVELFNRSTLDCNASIVEEIKTTFSKGSTCAVFSLTLKNNKTFYTGELITPMKITHEADNVVIFKNNQLTEECTQLLRF